MHQLFLCRKSFLFQWVTNLFFLQIHLYRESSLLRGENIKLARKRRNFSFSYDENWISSQEQLLLDPDIVWYGGPQYPNEKENFGIFLDSMPDTWGRTLMKRRAAINAREQHTPTPVLYDLDYLLGVHDHTRMGALRFKRVPEGDFLDNDSITPTPPWASVRELQHGASIIESVFRRSCYRRPAPAMAKDNFQHPYFQYR